MEVSIGAFNRITLRLLFVARSGRKNGIGFTDFAEFIMKLILSTVKPKGFWYSEQGRSSSLSSLRRER